MTLFSGYKHVLLKLEETNVPLTEGKGVKSSLTSYNKKHLLDILLRYKNLYNKGLSYVRKNIDRLKTMKKREVEKEIYLFLKEHNYIKFTDSIIREMSKRISENLIYNPQMNYYSNEIYLPKNSLKYLDLDSDRVVFNLFDKVYIESKFITNKYLKKILFEHLEKRKKIKSPMIRLLYNKNKKTFYISIIIGMSVNTKIHPYSLGIDIDKNGNLYLYSTKTHTYDEVKFSKKTIDIIKKIKKNIEEVKKSTSLSNNKKNNMIRDMKRRIVENYKHEINRMINYVLTKYEDHNINIERIDDIRYKKGDKYTLLHKIFFRRMLSKGIYEYKRFVRIIHPKRIKLISRFCYHKNEYNRDVDNFKCNECGYEDNIHKIVAYTLSRDISLGDWE